MKKLVLIIAAIIATLALILAFTPTDTIPLLPAIIGLVLGFIALKMYQKAQTSTKVPKVVIALSFLAATIVCGKSLFIEDTVAVDKAFEEKKEETKEDIEELNDLQELNELE